MRAQWKLHKKERFVSNLSNDSADKLEVVEVIGVDVTEVVDCGGHPENRKTDVIKG